jgi:transporter family-2 protein
MVWSLLLPAALGVSIVLQSGLNRLMARGWGLGPVTLFNSLILCMVSFVLWIAARGAHGWIPAMFRDRGGFSEFGWWYWIPGVLGFFAVAGVPLAISRIGALQTFVILIGAQLAGSIVWDWIAEGKTVTWIRVAGAVLAFVGAALVSWAE